MTGMHPKHILRTIGVSAPIVGTVAAEVAIMARGADGALERDDFWAVAIAVTWEALQQGIGGGGIRLRVRGALRDILRREQRALGRVAHRNNPARGLQTVRWPVYWPGVGVRVHLTGRQLAARNGTYYRRRKLAA